MSVPTFDRYRYRAFLAQIYSFEAPVEAALVATGGIDRALVRTHLKCDKLAADLDALGVDARELISTRSIRFRDAPEALGWLWVLHRNTLLHGILSRHLASRLPEPMVSARNYLSAFEGCAGALMRELGYALDAAARRRRVASRIVTAATDAFRAQHQWYQCEALSPRQPPVPPEAA